MNSVVFIFGSCFRSFFFGAYLIIFIFARELNRPPNSKNLNENDLTTKCVYHMNGLYLKCLKACFDDTLRVFDYIYVYRVIQPYPVLSHMRLNLKVYRNSGHSSLVFSITCIRSARLNQQRSKYKSSDNNNYNNHRQ